VYFYGSPNIAAHLIPTTDNVYDLGSSSYYWKRLYLANQLISKLATGTAPLNVQSQTLCTNLNADLLDGYHASSFLQNGWQLYAYVESDTDINGYTFSNLPAAPAWKIVFWVLPKANVRVLMRFNGDTNANYRWHYIWWNSVNGHGDVDSGSADSIRLTAAAAAGYSTWGDITIICPYSNQNKGVVAHTGTEYDNTAWRLGEALSGYWINTTSNITNISLFSSGSGSDFDKYGFYLFRLVK